MYFEAHQICAIAPGKVTITPHLKERIENAVREGHWGELLRIFGEAGGKMVTPVQVLSIMV